MPTESWIPMSNDQYGTLSVQQMSDYGHEQWLQYAIENIDNIPCNITPQKTFTNLF